MFQLKYFEKKKISKRHFLKICIWYLINNLIIYSFIPSSRLRIFLLKLFGATIGTNVIIHPYTNIKYPWKFKIGDNSWIGARVWVDNIENVEIGNNCCISQEVYFCTGNHNYKKQNFELSAEKIVIGNNSWIGAKSVISPGVEIKENSIIKLNSMISKRN